MALSDKNILITPNRGSANDPTISFTGADASNSATITLNVLNSGTTGILSFEGTSGQLFSIYDDLSGSIFSVNDISGIPSIEVMDTGEIRLAEYTGNVLIGTDTDNGVDKVQISGIISMNGLKQIQKTITAATTTTFNLSESNNFYMTLDKNVSFALSNVENNIGASGYIIMKQDGVGGRLFTLASEMKTPNGRAISQSTNSNALSLITYYVVSTDTVVVNYLGNFS